MLETLVASGINSINLDLGHVQVYRALVEAAELTSEQEQELFDALQRKAACEVAELLEAWQVSVQDAERFKALTSLAGDASMLNDARQALQGAPESVFSALDQLKTIADKLAILYPEVSLYFDLGELRGYNYHTGVVFAAYVSGQGQAIAKGGRYDGIGSVFGRARPATGFSTDLKILLEYKPLGTSERCTIFAPVEVEAAIVQKLRQQGERVVCQLPEQGTDAAATGCNRQLVCRNGEWMIEEL